jgi:cob(I)alamin adenosyltransferase
VKPHIGQGDDGLTGLPDGRRVPKHHALLELCGTLDELNCHLGVAAAYCQQDSLKRQLQALQSSLLALGAVATGERNSQAATPRIGPAQVAALEVQLDAAEAALPPLRRFLLPGGSATAAQLHVARAVCRRAERHAAELLLNPAPTAPRYVLAYLNRMSDLLFALARQANRLAGVPDSAGAGEPGADVS